MEALGAVAPDERGDVAGSAQCILDREDNFVREVDRYLRHNDLLKLRKKEILYKRWLKDVSEPLLRKIKDKVDSQSSKEMQKRKQEQYSLYLNHCKKKGYVALEAYDPSEYDPFFLKRRPECWKVSTPALQDPLLTGLQRWFLEMGAVEQCEPGRAGSPRAALPPLPLSRQRLDAAQWLKVPHAYIASEGRKTRR